MALKSYQIDNPQQQQKSFYTVMVPTVVEVNHINGQSRRIGGGVIIHPSGYVLTSAYLIDEGIGSKYLVSRKGQRGLRVNVIVSSKDLGYALLKIVASQNVPIDYAEVADNPPQLGHEVLSIGHPWDSRFSFTKGIINAENRQIQDLYTLDGQQAWELIFDVKGTEREVVQANRLGSDSSSFAGDHNNPVWSGCAVNSLSKASGSAVNRLSKAEGSPLFNWKGEVVGVYGFCWRLFDIGFPVDSQVITGWISEDEAKFSSSGVKGTSSFLSQGKRKKGYSSK